MKQTRNLLMTLFWGLVAIPALLYVSCEFLGADIAYLSGATPAVRYAASAVAILLTLVLLPLSLRFFRLPRIHADLLSRKAAALRKWGRLRLLTIGGLLIVNTLLYYLLGFEPAFGYLAVVVLLTLPFVCPTMSRCLAETESDSQEEAT